MGLLTMHTSFPGSRRSGPAGVTTMALWDGSQSRSRTRMIPQVSSRLMRRQENRPGRLFPYTALSKKVSGRSRSWRATNFPQRSVIPASFAHGGPSRYALASYFQRTLDLRTIRATKASLGFPKTQRSNTDRPPSSSSRARSGSPLRAAAITSSSSPTWATSTRSAPAKTAS